MAYKTKLTEPPVVILIVFLGVLQYIGVSMVLIGEFGPVLGPVIGFAVTVAFVAIIFMPVYGGVNR